VNVYPEAEVRGKSDGPRIADIAAYAYYLWSPAPKLPTERGRRSKVSLSGNSNHHQSKIGGE